jgi:hypothetical protein
MINTLLSSLSTSHVAPLVFLENPIIVALILILLLLIYKFSKNKSNIELHDQEKQYYAILGDVKDKKRLLVRNILEKTLEFSYDSTESLCLREDRTVDFPCKHLEKSSDNVYYCNNPYRDWENCKIMKDRPEIGDQLNFYSLVLSDALLLKLAPKIIKIMIDKSYEGDSNSKVDRAKFIEETAATVLSSSRGNIAKHKDKFPCIHAIQKQRFTHENAKQFLTQIIEGSEEIDRATAKLIQENGYVLHKQKSAENTTLLTFLADIVKLFKK